MIAFEIQGDFTVDMAMVDSRSALRGRRSASGQSIHPCQSQLCCTFFNLNFNFDFNLNLISTCQLPFHAIMVFFGLGGFFYSEFPSCFCKIFAQS